MTNTVTVPQLQILAKALKGQQALVFRDGPERSGIVLGAERHLLDS
jgi:hypothetical protein